MSRLRSLIALLLAALLAGCLKANQTLTLNKDASGSFETVYAVDEDAVAQIAGVLKVKKQVLAAAGEPVYSGPADEWVEIFLNPTDAGIRRKFKQYEKLGIRLEQIKVESKDAWRHVRFKATFKNIADVARADFFPELGLTLKLTAEGDMALTREKLSGDTEIEDMGLMPMLSPLLKGFQVVVNMAPPTRIIRSNAHSQAGGTASWTFSYDKDPNAVVAVQKQELRVVFEGKGTRLPIITAR